jgi:hypothetical protein
MSKKTREGKQSKSTDVTIALMGQKLKSLKSDQRKARNEQKEIKREMREGFERIHEGQAITNEALAKILTHQENIYKNCDLRGAEIKEQGSKIHQLEIKDAAQGIIVDQAKDFMRKWTPLLVVVGYIFFDKML